jgi:hypothetical protein
MYFLFAVLSASILIPAIRVQTPERPSKHGAEHEKLAYFLGKWVYEEEVKPTAYSRSGKYMYTESCEWFAGEFAIVCQSYNQNGAPRALSIMGYDLRQKTYTYFRQSATARADSNAERLTETSGHGPTMRSPLTVASQRKP